MPVLPPRSLMALPRSRVARLPHFRTASPFCALTKTGVLEHCRGFIVPPCPPEGDGTATALVRVSRFLLPTPSAGWQKKSKKENPPAYIPLRPQGGRGERRGALPRPQRMAQNLGGVNGRRKFFLRKIFLTRYAPLTPPRTCPEGGYFFLAVSSSARA